MHIRIYLYMYLCLYMCAWLHKCMRAHMYMKMPMYLAACSSAWILTSALWGHLGKPKLCIRSDLLLSDICTCCTDHAQIEVLDSCIAQ